MPITKILVQRNNGTPAIGKKVVLSIAGILSGGATKAVFTDSNGIALIEHASSGDAKVIVGGTTRTNIRVPGQTVVFI